jgi:ABC-type nickel/cobalt efflux system permease component RcnA
MKSFLLAMILGLSVLGWSGAALAQNASPFSSGAAEMEANAPAAKTATAGVLQKMRHGLFALQRDVNRALNTRLVAIKRGQDQGALLAGILFAFLYGVFHALGPGHGKSVVIGYFLGRAARPSRGLAMAAWIAVSHVVGAIVIVGVAHLLLSRALVSPTNEYQWLRIVSYAAILVIGLLMLRDWWRGGHEHAHHHHADGHNCTAGDMAWSERGRPLEQRALALAAGFVPCSGAILILLFAMANNLVLAGIAMAVAIAAGMGMTLAGLGVLSIFLRHQASLRRPGGGHWGRGMALLGPLFVILIGATLLLLAMFTPGGI